VAWPSRVRERLADATGTAWAVDPNSWHYPGATIRVVFYEKDDQR
jgi:hypothetical protein